MISICNHCFVLLVGKAIEINVTLIERSSSYKVLMVDIEMVLTGKLESKNNYKTVTCKRQCAGYFGHEYCRCGCVWPANDKKGSGLTPPQKCLNVLARPSPRLSSHLLLKISSFLPSHVHHPLFHKTPSSLTTNFLVVHFLDLIPTY